MSRVSKNIVFNLIGQMLIVALGFWGTRLVFHKLGDEALGILYFAIAINAVLTPIIDLGVSSTVVREVARHLRDDREYVVRLSRTTTLFYWSGYALLSITFWFVAPCLVSRWLMLKSLDVTVGVQALRILALGLLLMLPRSLYSNLLRGVERMELNNIIDVGTIALQQGGTIAVLIFGGGLVDIAYCYLASFLLSILLYVLAAAHFVGGRAFLPGFSPDVVRQNLSFTSWVGAYSLLAMIQMESDKVLMSKLIPIGLLGFYGVAQTMLARASRITLAVTQAAFPRLAALFHNGNWMGLMREYRRLQYLLCYGLVPIFAGLIFAARPLFTYLLSADAAKILLLPTALLCLGWYMNGTLNMPAIFSLAVERADIGAKQNFYALFVVLPVTAGLIWKWGLIGAGFSSVFYHLYAYSYGARRVAAECIKIRPRDWYLQIAKVMALAFLTYGVAWSIAALSGYNILSLALTYALASVVFLYIASLIVGDELRQGFLGQIRIRGRILRYIGSN